jgi:hypothetical protein
MSMNVVGAKNTLNLTGFSALETDQFGLSSAQASWEYISTAATQDAQWAALQAVLPAIQSAHPIFTDLALERRSVRFDSVRWIVDGFCSGIEGEFTDPIYNLDLDGNIEPIETHPDFASFATTANGARFDSDGLFLGFTNKSKPEWFGVTSYIRPGAVWTKTYYSRAHPNDLRRVGKIDEPEGYQPPIADSLNWLYLGMRYQQRGGAFQVTKYWKASGPIGWNQTIYS